MNEIPLPGLTPTPLGNYLAALGLLKAVSKKWPDARGFWRDDMFHLRGPFEKEDIVNFLIGGWEPTPFVRPWNPDEVEDKKTFDRIPSTFISTRRGLQFSLGQIEQSEGLKSLKKNLDEKKKQLNKQGGTKKEKANRVKNDSECIELEGGIEKLENTFNPALHRNMAPEITISVIDATLQTFTNQKEELLSVKAPLLGKAGGSDGRRDFMRMWMLHMQEIYASGQMERSENWLKNALGLPLDTFYQLPKKLSGNSWFPDAIKLHNSGQKKKFFTEQPPNPWLYVLACEGICLLSGSSSRRFGSGTRVSTIFPFITRSPSPRDKATSKQVRAEFWAPLWSKPFSIIEVASAFKHGRASFIGQAATQPHHLAEAILTLGTERGLTSFQRHSLSQTTSANTFEALPLGQYHLYLKKAHTQQCLSELNRWERRLPFDSSKKVLGLRRMFEDAVLALCERPDEYTVWQHLLITCAEIDRRVDRNKDLRKSCAPVPPLSLRWLEFLDDGSEEFELAASIASIRGNRKGGEGCGPLRENMFSVNAFERAQFAPGQKDDSWASFTKSPSNRVVWSGMNLLRDMNEVLRRRSVDSPLTSPLALGGRVTCPPSTLALFLDGQLDDARIDKLIPALLLLNWNDRRVEPHTVMAERRDSQDMVGGRNGLYILPRPYLLLKLLFQPYNFTMRKNGGIEVNLFGGNRKFPPRAPLALAALTAGDLNRAVSEAATRLRACGLSPVEMEIPQQSADYCERLAAALLVPFSKFHMSRAVDMLCNPESQED